ncbi:5-dehydro-2-deoxygluconokinase [Actinomadura sp. NPDC048394]|uniref:5-dehydro-2-deoxygluconokinase n=1 Tax=Actinomadura sp. NPDC048394 TaxID=3158223 RepID=UPI0033C1F02F
MSHDLITMGRVSVDIYPDQVGRPLEDVESFGKYLGGSPTNVAVAAARYGRTTAVITRTGDDPFGRYVHKALKEYGVDDRFVTSVPGLPTPLAFCEIFPPDDFPLYFYRYPKAPDLEIRPHELDMDAIGRARIVWATVTGLSQEPSREATLLALGAHTGHAVIDLDYRPMLWDDPGEAPHWAGQALERATVAVGNLEECEVAVGEREPEAAARAILARGPELAIVKMGPDGVLAATREETVRVPPVKVDVANGLGAGDAFGGAVCHGLLSGWDLERIIAFAGAAGAIVASRIACSAAMPDEAEVEALLAEGAIG